MKPCDDCLYVGEVTKHIGSVMPYVLSLIADPSGPPLIDESLIAAAGAALTAAGAVTELPRQLGLGEAAEIAFATHDAARAVAAVRGRLSAAAIDIVALPSADRRKALLVADLESTIIRNECLEELGDAIGRRPEMAAITRRAMNGEIDFAGALRERVGMLAGLPAATLDQVQERLELMPGARTLVATMRAHGARAALVSGGFRVFAERIGAALGFDHWQANELLIQDDKLSGAVAEPILDRETKKAILLRLAAEQGLGPEQSLAVGDGANDLPMILEAGLGVAYHAKPSVAAAAPVRIDHGDLTALLYLQGYAQDQFRE